VRTGLEVQVPFGSGPGLEPICRDFGISCVGLVSRLETGGIVRL